MRKQKLQIWTRLAMRFICILALIFVAFAHRPIAAGASGAIDLSNYQLPDGSIAIICVSDVDHGREGNVPHFDQQNCEACRISGAMFCASPAQSSGAAPQLASAFQPVPAQPILFRSIYPPAAPPQAPPSA